MKFFLPCEVSSCLLTDLDEGALPTRLALLVRLHVLSCSPCRSLHRKLRQLTQMAQGVGQAGEPAGEPDPGILAGAMARLAEGGEARPWPSSPVPPEAEQILGSPAPDACLLVLARTHEHLAGRRFRQDPFPYLPRPVLALLPRVGKWDWRSGDDGVRWAELLQDSGFGTRLQMRFAPPGRPVLGASHWFTHSILVLDGVLEEGDREFPPGQWLQVPPGRSGGLRAGAGGCWCLVRSELVRNWSAPRVPWTSFLRILPGRRRAPG